MKTKQEQFNNELRLSLQYISDAIEKMNLYDAKQRLERISKQLEDRQDALARGNE